MTNRKNKAYIPWHERIDGDLVKEITQQFVKDVFTNGFQILEIKVVWQEDGKFDVSTTGVPLTRVKPKPDEATH